MKYLDEFRDPILAKKLIDDIKSIATQRWAIMEVCGGQTHSIIRNGIDQLLTDQIEMIHGPGCPVCVTPLETIDKALAIAALPDVIFCSFGDMLRVPGSDRDLFSIKSTGGDIRIVYSPLDALKIARQNPDKEVVFFAIGFETTAPANAMAVHQAKQLGVTNFSVLVSHVLVPPAMEAILSSPVNRVQGFLAAGHVCSVMGFNLKKILRLLRMSSEKETVNSEEVLWRAKKENARALEMGLQIIDPRDRCIALAHVAFYGPETSFLEIIQKSIDAAYAGRDGYRAVSAMTWPIHALVRMKHMDIVEKELPRILKTARKIEKGVNQIDALFCLFEGIFFAGNPFREIVFDALMRVCSETNSWKASYVGGEAILMMATVDWESAHENLEAMYEGKIKRQIQKRFEEKSFPSPRSFF